ncbi:MAG: hypothetical protein EBT03_12805 [Betaproteobacteria bacterium]|nr:hypothetical protein [Betaproteobacteria bacterium]NCA17902.1 hypothetical protein [Betaproteobacteria bacterium]
MNKPFIKNLMLGMRLDEFVEGLLHHVSYETAAYATWGDPIEPSNLLGIPRNTHWWERLIRILAQSRDTKIRFVISSESRQIVLSSEIDLAPRGYDQENWWRSRGDVVKLNRFVKDFYGTRQDFL